MKRTILFVVMFLLVLGSMVGLAQEKPRVGVLRFTNDTSAGWWSGSVGRELSDMLGAELANTGAFQVLERREIDAVLGEQDLGASGRISEATKAKIGNIKGAKYLVAGTVSAFEANTSGVGGGIGFKGVRLGGKKQKAYIAIDVKVIDTETGEIVDARTIEANAKSKAVNAGAYIKGFSIAGGAHKKTPTGKAIRACLLYISEYLECSLVNGKDHSCMDKWDKMDRKRRKKTKDSIDLDM